MTLERFIVKEVTHAVEDAAVVNRVTFADQFAPDALHQVTLAHSRWSDQDRIMTFADEVTGGQFIDDLLLHAAVEVKVKLIE